MNDLLLAGALIGLVFALAWVLSTWLLANLAAFGL